MEKYLHYPYTSPCCAYRHYLTLLHSVRHSYSLLFYLGTCQKRLGKHA